MIGVAGTFAFAGGLPTPSASLVAESLAWLALANGVVCVVAIGLGSLTASRPGTITALSAGSLSSVPAARASSLGSIRRGLLDGVMLFLDPLRDRRPDGRDVGPESRSWS